MGVILSYFNFLYGKVDDEQIGPKSIICLIFLELHNLQRLILTKFDTIYYI